MNREACHQSTKCRLSIGRQQYESVSEIAFCISDLLEIASASAEDLIPRLLSLRPQDALQELPVGGEDLTDNQTAIQKSQSGWNFALTDKLRPRNMFRRPEPLQPEDSFPQHASSLDSKGQEIGLKTEGPSGLDSAINSSQVDKHRSGPFVSRAWTPLSQRAASLRHLAGTAPQRLWHRRKVPQVLLSPSSPIP